MGNEVSFYNTLPRYTEYALSSSSRCCWCHTKIPIHNFRISVIEQKPYGPGTRWFHFRCFWVFAKACELEFKQNSIDGMDELVELHRDMIVNEIRKLKMQAASADRDKNDKCYACGRKFIGYESWENGGRHCIDCALGRCRLELRHLWSIHRDAKRFRRCGGRRFKLKRAQWDRLRLLKGRQAKLLNEKRKMEVKEEATRMIQEGKIEQKKAAEKKMVAKKLQKANPTRKEDKHDSSEDEVEVLEVELENGANEDSTEMENNNNEPTANKKPEVKLKENKTNEAEKKGTRRGMKRASGNATDELIKRRNPQDKWSWIFESNGWM